MSGGETKSTGLNVPGFQHLSWLLPQHVDLVPELYFLFIALMMGQPTKLLPADSKVNYVQLIFQQKINYLLKSDVLILDLFFSWILITFGILCLVYQRVTLYHLLLVE